MARHGTAGNRPFHWLTSVFAQQTSDLYNSMYVAIILQPASASADTGMATFMATFYI